MPRNRLIATGLTLVVASMVGLSFAAVPLYRMFCAATGYGGTPKIGGAEAPGPVRFDPSGPAPDNGRPAGPGSPAR